MVTTYKVQIKDEVIHRFQEMGYYIEYRVRCAADYGVTQLRKRLIFIGIRTDNGSPDFPEPIVEPESYII